jgi:hypothetical protein
VGLLAARRTGVASRPQRHCSPSAAATPPAKTAALQLLMAEQKAAQAEHARVAAASAALRAQLKQMSEVDLVNVVITGHPGVSAPAAVSAACEWTHAQRGSRTEPGRGNRPRRRALHCAAAVRACAHAPLGLRALSSRRRGRLFFQLLTPLSDADVATAAAREASGPRTRPSDPSRDPRVNAGPAVVIGPLAAPCAFADRARHRMAMARCLERLTNEAIVELLMQSSSSLQSFSRAGKYAGAPLCGSTPR